MLGVMTTATTQRHHLQPGGHNPAEGQVLIRIDRTGSTYTGPLTGACAALGLASIRLDRTGIGAGGRPRTTSRRHGRAVLLSWEPWTPPSRRQRPEQAGDIVTVFTGGPHGSAITVEINGGRKAVAS